jgi:hypothetical protein
MVVVDRADAYVRLMTMCLQTIHAMADLPDDVTDIGELLRERNPYGETDGEETGQLVIAFGTPDMNRLMGSFVDAQQALLTLGRKRDQVPSLLQDPGRIHAEMKDVAVRDIQRERLLVAAPKDATRLCCCTGSPRAYRAWPLDHSPGAHRPGARRLLFLARTRHPSPGGSSSRRRPPSG